MRLSLAAAQLPEGGKSTVKCSDALSSCQVFFIITSVFDFSWVSYFLKVYLCFVMLPGFLPYVLLITAMWTWALVVGNAPTSGYRKKKFWSFLVKVKFSVCVWGGGAWKLPGWLASKWCSSVYWLLLLARILFFFNVCILYLYWMQDILLWKSQMQTEPMINRFQ